MGRDKVTKKAEPVVEEVKLGANGLPVRPPRGHKQKGSGNVITAKPDIVTNDGIVLKAHERLPSNLLHEYCQNQKRPTPKYYSRKPSHRYNVVLEDIKDSKKNLEFCPVQSFDSDKIAKDFSALLALWYFQKSFPLERKMPEPYSSTWKQMIETEKEEKKAASGFGKKSITTTETSILSTSSSSTGSISGGSSISISKIENLLPPAPQVYQIEKYEKKTPIVVVTELTRESADWLCDGCGAQNFNLMASGIVRVKCFKCSEKKSKTCALVAAISSVTIDTSTSVKINKPPPSAVLDLRSVQKYSSISEENKEKSELIATKKRKNAFFDAMRRANRPTPVMLSPLLRRKLELALGISTNDLSGDSNTNKLINYKSNNVPSLSILLNNIKNKGIIPVEFDSKISIDDQYKCISENIDLLNKQGFSDDSIAIALNYIIEIPDIVLDDISGVTQGNMLKIFKSSIRSSCLECLCLYVDESSLPRGFDATGNENLRSFEVFNKSSTNIIKSNNTSKLIETSQYNNSILKQFGWSDLEIDIAFNLIKNNNEVQFVNVEIEVAFLLWYATSKASNNNILPFSNEFILKILDSTINNDIDADIEQLILNEKESLESIYPDRFSYEKLNNMDHLSLVLEFFPNKKKSLLSLSPTTLDIYIHSSMDYPTRPPLVLIKNESLLNSGLLLSLQQIIWNKAEEFAGDMLMFQIASFIESDLELLLTSAPPRPLTISNILKNIYHNDNYKSNNIINIKDNTIKSLNKNQNEMVDKIVEDYDDCTTNCSDESLNTIFINNNSNNDKNKKTCKSIHPFWKRIKNDFIKDTIKSGKYNQMLESRKALPAWNSRSDFLKVMEDNRAMVVTGETGCGKTTQIPQYIFEENPNAKIIICQPRRLAAVGVATRVAEEMVCNIGDEVGYMVRGDSKASALTRLVFCTYGVLLRRLQDDPSISGIDYVILDEVHERGVDSDFALALLMSAMSKRQNLKIILMSATMSTDKFANYLGSSLHLALPSPVLHIPGYTFPVEDYYKNSYEDIVRNIYINGGESLDEYGEEFDSYSDRIGGRQRKGDLDYDLMVRLIIALSNGSKIEDRDVSANVPYHMLDKAEGSILVFMPGVPEISRLISLLSSTWSRSSSESNRKLRIMALHGNLSPNEQKKIFIPANHNELKIVISTNVAEASVTIPDVTVVIDCCRVKEIDFDIERQMTALIMKICAKDSLRQRRGRAGRVQKGRCFRLVTNGTFDKLQPHGVPEILRVPLERLILQIKAMSLNETCLQLLQRCPDCPEGNAIISAELMLIKLQALDNDGNLTSLGRSLSALPCDPSVGKLLIYGSLLGSVYHAAAVAACLTSRSPFISSTEESEQKRIELAKMSFAGTGISSDHMIMAKAIQEFDKITTNKRKFCNEKCLSFDRMLEIQQLQRDLLGDLVNIGFLKSLSNGLNLENSIENRNADKPKLIAATLCAGLYPKVAKIIRPPKRYVETLGGAIEKNVSAVELKFYIQDNNNNNNNINSNISSSEAAEKYLKKDADGNIIPDDISTDGLQRVFLHPSSVNFKNIKFKSSNFVLYGESQLSSNLSSPKAFLRDTTEITAYSLLFFGGKLEAQYLEGTVTVDNWIKFSAPGRICALVQALRRDLDNLISQKLDNPTTDITKSPSLEAVCSLLSTDGLG